MTTQEKCGDRFSEKQGIGVRKEQASKQFAHFFLGSHKKSDREPHLTVLHSVLAISSRLSHTNKNSMGAERGCQRAIGVACDKHAWAL